MITWTEKLMLIIIGLLLLASAGIVFLDNGGQCPDNNCHRAYILDQTNK